MSVRCSVYRLDFRQSPRPIPVHDWSSVNAGVFHDFHQSSVIAIRNALNSGRLPDVYYALAEQSAEGPIPDVVTLERYQPLDIGSAGRQDEALDSEIAVAVAKVPPRVSYTHEAEMDQYADKASRVAIRHSSGDQVVGYIEVVSPGNKHIVAAIQRFLDKPGEAMKSGCHTLVVDVHPPSPRDPRGIHARFWESHFTNTEVPGVTSEKPPGMSSYRSDLVPTAYFEPFAVGDKLIDMPAFLTPDFYVNVPLEETYEEAWQGVPRRWKSVIEAE